MKEGIKVGEIKKAIQHNKKLAENKGEGYEKAEEDWGLYNSPISSFGKIFKESLPDKDYDPYALEITSEKGLIFKNYIEKTLSSSEERNLTAIEFGGPGSELFKGFTKGFFDKTTGVCLEDIRDEKEKETDKNLNHSVIEGDILDPLNDAIILKVIKEINTDKFDLIISRMEGPLNFIDKNLSILDRIIRNWYKILNKNGLMFVQFDTGNNTDMNLLRQWTQSLREKFPELDIQLTSKVMRLHKKAGAPDELPPATKIFS